MGHSGSKSTTALQQAKPPELTDHLGFPDFIQVQGTPKLQSVLLISFRSVTSYCLGQLSYCLETIKPYQVEHPRSL